MGWDFCLSQVHITHTHTHTPGSPVPALIVGILGAVVPCCLDLSLSHQYGECLCMPLLPGSTFAIRVGIRERYKIRVSACIRMQKTY